ncbi:MAG: hypothetical protein AB1592_07230 [Pseudomonadota bacterium]
MFDPTTMIGFHTWLSLVAIAVGAVVLKGVLDGRPGALATNLFLATAVLTSATGYLIPAPRLLPSHIVGVVALVVLAIALYGRHARHLLGAWASIYAACLVISEYLLIFVAVAQVFQKVPGARALAPTGSVPPFAIAEGILLAAFVAIGWLAVRNVRRGRVALA